MDYKHVAAAEDLLITSAKRAAHSKRWLLPSCALLAGAVCWSFTAKHMASSPSVAVKSLPISTSISPLYTPISQTASIASTHLNPAVVIATASSIQTSHLANTTALVRMAHTAGKPSTAKSFVTPPSSTKKAVIASAAITHAAITHSSPKAVVAKPVVVTPQWQTVAIRKGDTLGRIFNRLGISSKQMQTLLKLKETRQALHNLKPSSQLKILLDNDKNLTQLSYVIDDISTLKISQHKNKFQEQIIRKKPVTQLAYAGLTITHTLSQAAQRAKVSPKLIQQVNAIFKDKADLAHIRAGDRVKLLYQENYIGNKKVGTGNVMAATLSLGGKTFKAVRYVDAKGQGEYYTPEGLSLRKGFIRIPVQYTHIGSSFSKRRLDPITHRYSAHEAVDFAAPMGTPIKASGDGKISFEGVKRGYGNMVMIKHDGKYESLYAHMSHFAKGLHIGTHVTEGQVIGYVGKTGWATGTHLHYEFHVNGVKFNPLTVALPSAAPLSRVARNRFIPQARHLMAQLEMSNPKVQLASNDIDSATSKS